MKRFSSILLALAALFSVACNPKNETVNTVSFNTVSPILKNGVFTLNLKATYNGTNEVIIPVAFSGTAEKNKDYKLTAEQFVLGGAKPVTEIIVEPLIAGAGKTVHAELKVPAGFQPGKFPIAEFKLTEKIGYLSFTTDALNIEHTLDVNIETLNGEGKKKSMENSTEINIEVDTEKSTLKEGIDFTIEGSKKVIVPQKKSTGTFSIKLLKKAVDPAKDKIVIKFGDNPKFNLGTNANITISAIGSPLLRANGKWVIEKLVTTYDSMQANWGVLTADEKTTYPKFNDKDSFTIDLNDGSFTPNFQSELKDFFIGKSKIKESKIIKCHLSGSNLKSLQLVEFDNINRKFTSKAQSSDKTALVGIKFDKEGLMHIYIVDYEPDIILASIAKFMSNGKEKPFYAEINSHIEYIFKKAQ